MDSDELLILTRCGTSGRSFNMRALPDGAKSTWFVDYAYPVREEWMRSGGSKPIPEIHGELHLNWSKYAGCPHCGNRSFVQCRCGRFACWSGSTDQFVCPWCRNVSAVQAGSIRQFSGSIGQ